MTVNNPSDPYNWFVKHIPVPPPAEGGGAGGDPHFKTWSGQSFDFHGHCDLVLLHNSHFDQGEGISIHIRSSPYKKVFSYISDAAFKIGNDVLEVGGKGRHFLNGEPQQTGAGTGIERKMSGYSLTSSITKKGRSVYKIHLGGKEEIVIREYRDWLTISLMHPSEQHFGGSQGLMGTFPTGDWIGRDGITIHKDITSFGIDWQTQAARDGGLLFREPSPYSDSCELPNQDTMTARHRRLEESAVGLEQAMDACAHWGQHIDDCVLDVQVSGDLEVAMNGPI